MSRRSSASLCSIRLNRGQLEVLLERRQFWNLRKQRLMSYPGEWTFSGGSWEPGDRLLSDTAIREFREELGYEGKIIELKYLRQGTSFVDGQLHDISYWAAILDKYEIAKLPNSEVLEARWFFPQKALRMIKSRRFECSQRHEIARYPLASSLLKASFTGNREFPVETVETLNYIEKSQDLHRWCMNYAMREKRCFR